MPRQKTRGMAAGNIFEVARDNRKKLTPAEEQLWEALRNRKLAGLKFRKQHPFGHFVLDFFCNERMLAIEIDGGIHDLPENKELDQERTTQLGEKGIRILRFSNEEVMINIDNVLTNILAFIQNNPLVGTPLLDPALRSRRGAGGEV